MTSGYDERLHRNIAGVLLVKSIPDGRFVFGTLPSKWFGSSALPVRSRASSA
jgi:hypothetical protein